ncbi:MAG: hypothetical protein JRN24_00250 [Nitrososphaerota archaeon]|nr:hypothetical protein [Nitrososphaerota archaeon]
MVLAIVGLTAALTATVLGWRWPHGWFPAITISDEVEALLAMGTLALAYAALVQAVSGLEAIERRYRPSLSLCIFDSYQPQGTTLRTPLDVGGVLAVRNLGPGRAKELKLTWFSYPASTEAKSFFKAQTPPMQATSVGGLHRAYLDEDPEILWELELPVACLTPLDYIIELEAADVFDRPSSTQRYHLSRVVSEDASMGYTRRYSRWQLIRSLPGHFEPVPSVQDMLDRARASPPPFHWDLS